MQQQIDSTLAYHLEELESALKATDLGRNRPILLPEDRTILDVGCGIGQSFVAFGPSSLLWMDALAVSLGAAAFALAALQPRATTPR